MRKFKVVNYIIVYLVFLALFICGLSLFIRSFLTTQENTFYSYDATQINRYGGIIVFIIGTIGLFKCTQRFKKSNAKRKTIKNKF